MGNLLNRITKERKKEKERKKSLYRPGQALKFPGGWDSQIWRESAREGGKVVSRTHRPPLPPRKYSWYSFLLEVESTLGPCCGRKESMKNSIRTRDLPTCSSVSQLTAPPSGATELPYRSEIFSKNFCSFYSMHYYDVNNSCDSSRCVML